MTKIKDLQAYEVLDSRGNPTVALRLTLDSGQLVHSMVPSGASTGIHEALELRDGAMERYFGKGVIQAVENVNGPIKELLLGKEVTDQSQLDQLMIEADGTETKKHFGANAILAASMAIAKAGALVKNEPLYKYLGSGLGNVLPCPMLNIINGGAHADNNIDFQEFMIRPVGASSFKEGLRISVEVYHTLKALLKQHKLGAGIGDEGGFAPELKSDEEAIEWILEAISKAGYEPGKDITLALDCAATELYDSKSKTYIEKKRKAQDLSYKSRTSQEQAEFLAELYKKYPIDSIEDGLDEEDWEGWAHLTKLLGKECQLVGDDIFVTNPSFLKRGFQEKVANSILIKPNQIGTVSETLHTIRLAHEHGYQVVISHRSGETSDTFIADLSVAIGAGQIKTGAPCRSDRVSKYNRLLEIEMDLGDKAQFKDSNPFSISKKS